MALTPAQRDRQEVQDFLNDKPVDGIFYNPIWRIKGTQWKVEAQMANGSQFRAIDIQRKEDGTLYIVTDEEFVLKSKKVAKKATSAKGYVRIGRNDLPAYKLSDGRVFRARNTRGNGDFVEVAASMAHSFIRTGDYIQV